MQIVRSVEPSSVRLLIAEVKMTAEPLQETLFTSCIALKKYRIALANLPSRSS